MPQAKQKITPHPWFDEEAKEAAEFYVSVFPESKVNNVTTLHGTPSSDVADVGFEGVTESERYRAHKSTG